MQFKRNEIDMSFSEFYQHRGKLSLAICLLVHSPIVFADAPDQRSFPSFSHLKDRQLEEAERYPLQWSPDSVRWQVPSKDMVNHAHFSSKIKFWSLLFPER